MTSRIPAGLLSTILLLAALLSPVGASVSQASAQASTQARADFDTIANLDELTGDHATAFRLYHAFFTREPDAEGALYWVRQVDHCVDLETVADSFAVSAEFRQRYGAVDDARFVELIYRNVLDRVGDIEGLTYWAGLLADGTLSRGGVVLHVSLSPEFASRHRYPSDGVTSRGCERADIDATDRQVFAAGGRPMATVAGLTIAAPAALIERAGFHQSSHPGALAMTPITPSPVRTGTMDSRGRGTDRRGAVDIVTEPGTVITAPVSGTVARAGGYTLYCKYRDGFVVINPDDRPDLEVKILHIQDVAVRAGQRVEVGDRLATSATLFPFRSQIDKLTAEPSWPHVHIEVVDPSIPRKRSSGGGCS